MNQFLRHEPCPNCRRLGHDRSGNNLGVWSDHKWCFACGWYEGKGNSLNIDEIWEKLNKKKYNERGHTYIDLPSDFTYSLPVECLTWLQKYGITDREIIKHRFGWSAELEELILPVYDLYGNLVFRQGRSFSQDSSKRKYNTRGNPEKLIHIIGMGIGDSNSLCLVEDAVSAIKVGRVQQAMPLWGSQIALERARMLSERFSKVWIWLDKDAAMKNAKKALEIKPYFDQVTSVITDQDPKCYNEEQIRGYLFM